MTTIDYDKPAHDRADCDETIFKIRMLAVEDFQIVDFRLEQPARLFERNTVLLLIYEVLLVIPLEVH